MKDVKMQVSFTQGRLYNPEKHLYAYVQDCINDFIKLNEIARFICDFDQSRFESIVQVKFEKDQISSSDNVSGKLIFAIELQNKFAEFDKGGDSTFAKGGFSTQEEFEYWKLANVANYFYDFTKKLIALSFISFPGGFELSSGTVTMNDTIVDCEGSSSLITTNRLMIDYIKDLGWPKFKKISTLDVFEWCSKNEYNFDNLSKSKTERAINAFTFMFDKSGQGMMSFDLLWALLGIEAIYCTSKEGLANQIFERTQVVLGDMKDYKVKLKQMYDFRSRLIHGDIEIPSFLSSDYLSEADDVFHDKLHDSAFLATAILVCTFQEMIIMNTNEFVFKQTLISKL